MHEAWASTGGQSILWGFSIISLLGSYFNGTTRFKLGYALWLCSDSFFVFYNFYIGEIQQSIFYFVTAITMAIGYKNTRHIRGWLRRTKV
ncbi:MAG: hypothetical protein K2L24_01025 [Opitutales bacterium]|nr:hypothetical protein [Opitutales bacterium]